MRSIVLADFYSRATVDVFILTVVNFIIHTSHLNLKIERAGTASKLGIDFQSCVYLEFKPLL